MVVQGVYDIMAMASSCIHISKFIKLYTLNTNVLDISTDWFLKITHQAETSTKEIQSVSSNKNCKT